MGVVNRLQHSGDGWKSENIFAFLMSSSCNYCLVVSTCGKWRLKPAYELKTNNELNHSGPINSKLPFKN